MDNTKLVGVFSEEEQLVAALHEMKEKGKSVVDIYTPYPVTEALEMVGKHSRLPAMAYLYGWFGATAVLSFLYWAAVKSWPINYGGKPFNAFPSFIIITLILTIFTITILSLFTFSIRSRLFPGQKAEVIDIRATDDHFLIVADPGEETEAILKKHGAVEVYNTKNKSHED
jgi:hypothetical protein